MPRHTILIVEDDPVLRLALRRLLERGGYAVVEAPSAAQALILAGAHQPSLILLDLGLPDGDGLEVAQELRRRVNTARIPIVVLTGELVLGRRAEAVSSICAASIPKPFSAERLERDLKLLLRLDRRGGPRRFPRFAVETPARCRLRGNGEPAAEDFVAGVVRTLSEGGLRIDLPNPVAVASILDLRLPMPAGEVIAAGKVVYSLYWRDERTDSESYQHGVQFVDLHPQTLAALTRLMKGGSLPTQ